MLVLRLFIGARASNGCNSCYLLKRGSEDHTEINFECEVRFQFFFISQYEFLNAHDYLYYMRSGILSVFAYMAG